MAKLKYTIQHLGKGYMHYIALDAKTADKFIGKTKRVLCIINDQRLHCALLKQREIGHYIMLSKDALKRINAKLGDEIIASFEIDDSPIQFEESEVWNEVLLTDTEACQVWQTLTDGNKRSIVYWIKAIKSIDKQIARSLIVAEKIKLGITNIRKIMERG